MLFCTVPGWSPSEAPEQLPTPESSKVCSCVITTTPSPLGVHQPPSHHPFVFLNTAPSPSTGSTVKKCSLAPKDGQTDRGAGQTYGKVEEEKLDGKVAQEVGRTQYSIGTASMGAAGRAEVGRGRREKQDEVKKTREGSREEGRVAGKMSMGSSIAWNQG